jgi:hypothetical protein
MPLSKTSCSGISRCCRSTACKLTPVMYCQQPVQWNLTDSQGHLHDVHVWVALQLAIQYAAAYHLSTEQTAEVLADSLLKGLLAAHHDSGGAIRDAWTAAGFREACEVCVLAGTPYAAPVEVSRACAPGERVSSGIALH